MTARIVHGDCLAVMRGISDKSVVTIADPPYGIGKDWEKRDRASRSKYRNCTYMNVRPPPEYFDEMFRVSANWILWGWNYFTDILPPTNYLVVWDKMSNQNQVIKYSKCEIAGTTYRVPCNLVSIGWDGYRMGEETGHKKIHPHQKPVALYRWLLDTYVIPTLGGMSVLDPFMGSGALAVACRERGVDYVGCEADRMFFDAAADRISKTFSGTSDTLVVDGENQEGEK